MSNVISVWQHTFITTAGRKKTIQIICGDITTVPGNYDVVVCSAFRGSYHPTYGTLIGALLTNHGISVKELSTHPALDVRSMGCWLSEEAHEKFRRVACVEIVGLRNPWQYPIADGKLLTGVFSSLRFVLEQADNLGIPVRSVISPVLGTGKQRIELSYIAGPLFNQCMQALKNIDALECFTFCERSEEKARDLAEMLKKIIETDSSPDVFISYSSRRLDDASQMRESFQKSGLTCWMAPESIPPGSSYLEEIAVALGVVPVVSLLLTPEAEASRWVSKEIETAIESGCEILPYQPSPYEIGDKFRFMLKDVQIFQGWLYSEKNHFDILAAKASQRLQEHKQKMGVK